MESRGLMWVTAVTVSAVLAGSVAIAAQEEAREKPPSHHHYQLIDLGTLGGPQSYLAGSNAVTSPGAVNQVLNNRGTVVGWADTPTFDPYAPICSNPFPNGDCFLVHAFQRQKGVLTDLGVLPGGDASDAKWISDTGLIAGESRNGLLDPLVPGFPEVRAVLWKDGEAIDLGTLGGNESSASSVNNRGQVVGFATNTIPEALPFSFLGAQIRAFLWQDGAMRDLGTLGSGNDSFAEFVNERGQVAGWSFTNGDTNPTTGLPTFEPFLWEQGTMHDLGQLGGTIGYPYGLNNRGQVIGASNLPGDPGCLQPPNFFCQTHPFLWDRGVLKDLGTFGGNFGFALGINDSGKVVGWASNENDQAQFAFLWKDGVMTNLGTLNGDDCSAAFNINSAGQIVGESFPCAGGPGHGFIWQNGFMTDLNALLPPGTSLTPEGDGASINERGEIAEMGLLPGGDIHGFLLVPCDENHPHVEGCDYSLVEDMQPAARPQLRQTLAPMVPAALWRRTSPFQFPMHSVARSRRIDGEKQ
jgi:probable HAF family extracellular repeat protein